MAIVRTVVAVRRGRGTDCDCLSEGLKGQDFKTTVQCTWQPRDVGAVVTRYRGQQRPPFGSGRPGRRMHRQVCLVALNSGVFLESAAYEGLGVYTEQKLVAVSASCSKGDSGKGPRHSLRVPLYNKRCLHETGNAPHTVSHFDTGPSA